MTGLWADSFIGKTVLGRFRIVRPIGRGGMGIIYLARQEGAARFVKPVVVKRAAPDLIEREPDLVEVLGREARIMSHLHAPSIVNVIDFAQEEGAYLLVLDYVHGFHLGQWHRFLRRTERTFPTNLAIHITCKVLDALSYAHTARGADEEPLGIIHRDVSPGNVLIDVSGHVRLADFGIARMHSDHTEQTDDRALLKGKFAYMAPELIARADPSPSTDLYAAATVLQELLLGQNEMKGETIERTIARILNQAPTPPSTVRDDAPKGLDEAIAKAMAKKPEERFATAGEFAEVLRALPGIDGEELDEQLEKAVTTDFRDPRISSTLGVTDLATLDRAWREVSSASFESVPETESNRAADTVVAPPPPGVAEKEAAGKNASGKTIAIGAVVVGAIALAAGVAVALRGPGPAPAGPAPVIIVNGQVSGDGVSAGASAARPSASTTGSPSAATSASPSMATNGATATGTDTSASAASAGKATAQVHADGADGLTRAFSKQQGQIAKCFTSNATDVSGAPEIAIRFGVNTAGHVTSAQVLPPAVAATPLGACLAGVAQATAFGPQPHDVSFRIPIVARRTQ